MSTAIRDRRQFSAQTYRHKPIVEIPPPHIDEYDALEVPHQRHQPDFPFRGRLIAEAQRVRAMRGRPGISKDQIAKADACALKVQEAIRAVNIRIWGNPNGPDDGMAAPRPAPAAVGQKKGFARAFFEVACRRLPTEDIARYKRDAENAAATSNLGFLRRFENAVRAALPPELVDSLRTEAIKEADI